ncbi:glycoside hydrolase family 27 protein [Coniophora puteana RWD-64-598 SS2]|uniref:Alpha-galactosidase n=1 Tax=Coniophora puteana (strain RWD-64-598) TaxID=741705 RepID=A0A5M3MHJ0_CONPW|nr:glycoside hydrolase family 27 protein [Coniophora puteana RWD-64-598 SS2]EIW78698.1 glycoside hydrolase family 27 protein [Coniophora puteana RWD-64-598 SS2]
MSNYGAIPTSGSPSAAPSFPQGGRRRTLSDLSTGTTHSQYYREELSIRNGLRNKTMMTSILTSLVCIVIGVAFGTLAVFVRPSPPMPATDMRVAKLPVMGYNTWNAYYCDISEARVLEAAYKMMDYGLTDVGYNYVNIDDCYSLKERDAKGNIVEDPDKFPHGMRTLTNKIHDLGLKTGIYSDSGWFTCQLYPGSFGNEDRDAQLFHEEWGFDYLKYDNCAVPFDNVTRENIKGRFQRMGRAINELAAQTGKEPMVLSLCEWGREQGWVWGRRYGQSWRTTDDIGANWPSVASIINQNSFITWASDFYGHNDMDMLEIGNAGLNYEEQKTHFTAWALMKSPLFIGTNLANIPNDSLAILKNEEIIAINQDPVVGSSVAPFRWGLNRKDWTYDDLHPAQYWSGESENGTVVMMINTLDAPADMYFNLTESPWIRAGREYHVRDLWTHTDNGTAVRSVTAHNVPAHGVVALLLQDAGDEPANLEPACAQLEWCIRENGTLVGPPHKVVYDGLMPQ